MKDIFISRKENDLLLKKNIETKENAFENAIHYMTTRYRTRWTLEGRTFLNVKESDFHIIT